MIEVETRLRVGRGLGKTETQASAEALRQLQRRGHPEMPPPLVSDGFGSNREAIVSVYGRVPAYKGVGRPPEKKRPVEGWQYLQVVKHRNEHGRFTGTTKRVVFGSADEVEPLSEATSFVERTHLTSRQMNARLVRKGLGFSKAIEMHKAAAAWEDATYNLMRPLKTLHEEINPAALRYERRYQERTPAMAAGLTDHVWSVKELLRTTALLLNNT